ncbi:hypothetical protein STCU_00473 [Strigomonas culicis]|uniref:Uncharacterized protein n=1 Tax=Strigomonas culicis TaxID=28005 RepID=S9W397_9TRYP|nr:hypothetical protein STCU_05836 [Strigomonas culicis]EPY29402.1 hypothetical protein STCU_04574 [Strigomonas culicis]EPY33821.1 hypothetical protein STCU_01945 [Strigomonas culicis]EPY36654.1 hypothetical protein STCU_00473 [Strigomonas culicis]|eukprot:EPY27268.1 hypothetical protein STCU_05836 [Strigomonas culicis]
MFGRRVASSCGIPKTMYARLGINSAKQANRMLPPLVAIQPSIERIVSGNVLGLPSALSTCTLAPMDLAMPPNLLAALGITPQILLSAINANPLLLRMISDTMCTYSVILCLT